MNAQELRRLVKIEDIIRETYELIGRGRYRRAREHDSLVIDTQEQIYYWNSKSDQPGDVYTWLQELNDSDFRHALNTVAQRAGVDLSIIKTSPLLHTPPQPPIPRYPNRLTAPPIVWQERGREIVARAQATLWGDEGRVGLTELRRRGFTDQTLRDAGLGWNPDPLYDSPSRWGFDGGNQIWVPRGITIPWEISGQLFRIRVRRPDEDIESQGPPRYIGPRVYPEGQRHTDHEALYNADALKAGHPAILVEGEIDCLTISQQVGEVAAVATGSTGGSRRPYWLTRLSLASVVLVAYDADQGGDKASCYWLESLDNAKRWRPLFGDVNQMHQYGDVSVRAWVRSGLFDVGIFSNNEPMEDNPEPFFPSTVTAAFAVLRDTGINLRLDRELIMASPKGAITPEIANIIKTHREGLFRILKEQAAVTATQK